jgi:glycine betaine catabolism B
MVTAARNEFRPMNQVKFLRKLVVLNGVVPLGMLAWDAWRENLGANPVSEALHITGMLSLVFLFLSLAISPLRWLTGWGGWTSFRRVLGLYAFFYALVHLGIYIGFDRALNFSGTLHEISTRRFLQVGFIAWLLMIPLAITSTNRMIQRIGPKRWKLLHRAAYLVAALGVLHYFMQVKADVRLPLVFAFVLAGLLMARFGKYRFEASKKARENKNRQAILES